MEMRRLSGGRLQVSALGLGCMGMADVYGPADQAECEATLRRALDLGITLFDTAEVYGPFTNEELLARVLKPMRKHVCIATKVGYRLKEEGEGLGRISGVDGRPEHVRAAAKACLRRLGGEAIDLLLLHRVDPTVPVEETVGALSDLVHEGDVLHLGLCEASATTLRRAHATHPMAVLQTEYSLWSREPEQSVLPACRELGIGFMAYAPLGRGFLTGSVAAPADLPLGDVRRTLPRFQAEALAHNHGELVPVLQKLAVERDATPAQLALAWLLAQGSEVIPIPGAKRRTHLEENAAAVTLVLTKDERDKIAGTVLRREVQGSRYGDAQMRMVNL
jgi:aryl-alcohol dehydrogenase-like predicted oxidoreductase